MPDLFDASAYVRQPVVNVASAIGLATALIHAVPGSAPPSVHKAAKRLHESAVALHDAWRAAQRAAPKGPDARPVDKAIDNAWAALHGRLSAYASLDATEFPQAARAGELLAALFPEGLGFLKLPYAEEWAEGKRRLTQIEEDGLAGDIDALAGKDFLAAVRANHARYGEAIGVTAPRPMSDPAVTLAEPKREVARAIAAYALQVVAAAQEAENEATARTLLHALAPLDAYRIEAARRSKGKASDSDEVPEDPIPDLPLPA